MRFLSSLLLVLLTLAPVASAQTFAQPISGAYADVYVVAGRVVDHEGYPAAGADLVISLSQRGVTAKPLQAKTNCYGDFITAFTLRQPERHGSVRVELPHADETKRASNESRLDPFFRRSDLTLQLPYRWEFICPQESQHWLGRVTGSGRILNRTASYEVNGTTLDAKPVEGYLRMRLFDVQDRVFCPPTFDGQQCEPIPIDERGDFRYSWTFPEGFDPRGARVQVILGEKTWNATVNPVTRLATFQIEVSGQGPAKNESPAAPVAVALLALVGLALVLRRRA